MKFNKSKKIISTFLMLFMIISQLGGVFAMTVGDTANLYSKGECEKGLRYTKPDGTDLGVLTHYVVYNENGKEYPAYCLDIELPGVSDDNPYSVTAMSMDNISNSQAVWRVLLNGFPYKSAAEMGLGSDTQAFQATKQAIYSVLDGRDTSKYYGSNDIGTAVANKIRELANIGRNGSQTYTDPVITCTAQNEAAVDSINDEYVSETFKIDSSVNSKDIKVVLNTLTAPKGSYVADTNNTKKTTFNKGDTFKVLVPRKNITSELNLQMSLNGQCETYPVLFGKAPDGAGVQNYALTADPFVMSAARATMHYIPTFDLDVNKISSKDSEITKLLKGSKLANAKFTVVSEDGSMQKIMTTDENGLFYLKDLPINVKFTITEIEAPEYYLILDDQSKITIEAKYDGDDKVLTIENEPVETKVNVDKEGPTEAERGEIITYDFSNISNLSNVDVSEFIWGDKLPREVTLQKIETGTWNEEKTYRVQYITNKKSGWETIGEYSSTENNEIDFTQIELEKGEYIEEFRLVFGDVKKGFCEEIQPKVYAKVNDNVKDKKIFVNKTYVTASYKDVKMRDDDEAHTVVYTKEKVDTTKPLPKTGYDY